MQESHCTIEQLPPAFLARMKRQLGDRYEAFLASYAGGRTYGLRFNPLKADRQDFLKKVPFALRDVPWADEGFYYEADVQPGRHALHDAGLYYIQEPSAMAAVPALDPEPGDRVLDLCAAPGGKSTQIAGRMKGIGLLVSNEIIPARAKILSQNIERMGVTNCVVCRESPERLAEAFPEFFDKILVDAPCSGEGMFRKDDTAVIEWSEENVAMCAARQKNILQQAARMLRPGGVLVYSTCTYSEAENEDVINGFLDDHPEFKTEEAGPLFDMEHAAYGMVRLWPHRIEGEGHFVARLRKAQAEGSAPTERAESAGCAEKAERTESAGHAEKAERAGNAERPESAGRAWKAERTESAGRTGKAERSESAERVWKAEQTKSAGRAWKAEQTGKAKHARKVDRTFGIEKELRKRCADFLCGELELTEEGMEFLFKEHMLLKFGEWIYLIPEQMISLDGLQIERPGVQIGLCERDRLKPSHALAMALRPEWVRRHYEMSPQQTEKYLCGETFEVEDGLKGWYLLSYLGISAGWGKAAAGQMKNHYPKGLRKQ